MNNPDKKCHDCSKRIINGCRCEDCRAKNIQRTKFWREKNFSHVQDYNKRYRENHKQKLLDYEKKRGNNYYNKNRLNPEFLNKVNARIIAHSITIEGLCEVCKERPAQERHHKDYSQPKNIIAVCVDCHHKIHRKIKPLVL